MASHLSDEGAFMKKMIEKGWGWRRDDEFLSKEALELAERFELRSSLDVSLNREDIGKKAPVGKKTKA